MPHLAQQSDLAQSRLPAALVEGQLLLRHSSDHSQLSNRTAAETITSTHILALTLHDVILMCPKIPICLKI